MQDTSASATLMLQRHARARKQEDVRTTAKVKGRYVRRAPRAWTHELALSLAVTELTWVLPRYRHNKRSNPSGSDSAKERQAIHVSKMGANALGDKGGVVFVITVDLSLTRTRITRRARASEAEALTRRDRCKPDFT